MHHTHNSRRPAVPGPGPGDPADAQARGPLWAAQAALWPGPARQRQPGRHPAQAAGAWGEGGWVLCACVWLCV